MSQEQGTVLRNGKIIDTPSETNNLENPDMAQSSSHDSDVNEGPDISSQLTEIRENYERKISALHQEFSELKNLMMAIVSKNNAETQPSGSKVPSKPTQQLGFDNPPSEFGIRWCTYATKICNFSEGSETKFAFPNS